MKLSNISTAPYRPQIKRLGQKDLPSHQFTSELDTSSTLSKKKWFHDQQNRIPPDRDYSWVSSNKLRADLDNQKKNNNSKKLRRRVCFGIIIAIIILLLLGAIIGIILGLTLPSSTTTESSTTKYSSISTISSTLTSVATTTTISIVCLNTGHGLIAFQNGSTPTTWTSYLYSFSATKIASTLVFGFQTDGTNSFYLDNVSVIDTTAPSNQLLINPSFENSTTTPPAGWIVSCEMTSCGSSATRIETNSQCSSGYCFESFCSAGRSALIFLSQTFATINGNSYNISFILKRTNIGSSGIMAFYLDII